MRKFLISGIFLFVFASNLFSNTNHFANYIGIWGGISTGRGISYRYRFPEWGWQVQFVPLYYDKSCYFSLGGIFQRFLVQLDSSSLFLYLGMEWMYSSYSYYEYTEDGQGAEKTYETGNFNLSIGPGFEVYLLDRVVVTLCFGYAIYNTVYPAGAFSLNFDFGIGLFYRF